VGRNVFPQKRSQDKKENQIFRKELWGTRKLWGDGVKIEGKGGVNEKRALWERLDWRPFVG